MLNGGKTKGGSEFMVVSGYIGEGLTKIFSRESKFSRGFRLQGV
jgi:hypothetical protein